MRWRLGGEHTSGLLTRRLLDSLGITDAWALGLWDTFSNSGFRGLVLTGGHRAAWPRSAGMLERRECGEQLLCVCLIFSANVSIKCLLLPWWLRQWRICLQCRRPGFHPWVRKIPWRWEWQPAPVFLPGEFHGQRSLAGYTPWGHKESDTTEWLTHTHTHTHTYLLGTVLLGETRIKTWTRP